MTAPAPIRLAWLDALRGFAALTVVWFHLSPLMLGNARHLAIMRHIDLGKYGVLLFFLVSGYVIPMSLERHGDLRKFWIGRLCRVYPAYLGAIALVGALALAGWGSWQESFSHQTVSAVLGHATMMTELLGLHGAVRVFWTLSYEMVFYLVVSGLFAWRLHRYSAWWAAGLALAGLLLGPTLPNGLFAGNFAGRRVTAVVLAVLLCLSLLAYIKERLALAAGAVGIGFLLLPALDGHPAPDSTTIASWQGLQLLAVMFAGTVVYRAHSGQLSRFAAVLSLTVVALGVIGAHWTYLGPSGHRVWPANVAAVAVTFLLAYAMRNRSVPPALTWLGRISYSLYLLHAIVLGLIPRLIPGLPSHSLAVRLAVGVTYLAVAITLAWLSYRFVEIPGQALGRRLTARPAPVLVAQRAAPGTGRGENARESV
ncbi:acyltransferase [Actinoplanes sp. NPDC051411]|uniref:acyltransferase family protein n=1 Tax=Actinoplanes sp. NPDC051411 TaxID=3155522 RepID=UPI00344564DB